LRTRKQALGRQATDVSGIVKEIGVSNNQEVAEGQVLFRMDDLPFRLALERAEAQVGIVRNDLSAQGKLRGHAGADQAGPE
jgi:multidrug resistance efflux pump